MRTRKTQERRPRALELQAQEKKTESTWYCGAAGEIIKIVHHECKWRTRVQVSPVTLQGIGFLLARARLIVKSSLRSPDLENAPRENLIFGEALLKSAQYIYGIDVDFTLKIIKEV